MTLEESTENIISEEIQPADVAPTFDPEKLDSHKETDGVNTKVTETEAEINWQDLPENPFNWSWPKRIWQLCYVAILAWLITLGSSVYTPGIPQITEQLHVSETVAYLGLTLFTLGLGFAPIIAAPISETLGRKIVLNASLVGYMLFTLGAGFSRTFAALLVCRFFAGMAGAPVLAVGGGLLADVLPIHLRGLASSFYLCAPFLGPALGPVLGGFAAQYENWRWTEWVILFAAVPIFIMGLTTSETYKKIILKRLAKKQGTSIAKQGPTGTAAIRFFLMVTLIRPLSMLVTEPIVLAFSAYSAFTFSIIYAFYPVFPIVFSGIYGFDLSQTGLAFIGIGVGCILSLISTIIIDQTVYQKMYRRVKAEGGTTVAPEHRLYQAMLGSVLVVIGLFWFAWTARKDIHWISPLLASVPFAWGNLSIFVRRVCLPPKVCAKKCGGRQEMKLAKYMLGRFPTMNSDTNAAATTQRMKQLSHMAQSCTGDLRNMFQAKLTPCGPRHFLSRT